MLEGAVAHAETGGGDCDRPSDRLEGEASVEDVIADASDRGRNLDRDQALATVEGHRLDASDRGRDLDRDQAGAAEEGFVSDAGDRGRDRDRGQAVARVEGAAGDSLGARWDGRLAVDDRPRGPGATGIATEASSAPGQTAGHEGQHHPEGSRGLWHVWHPVARVAGPVNVHGTGAGLMSARQDESEVSWFQSIVKLLVERLQKTAKDKQP